MKTDGNRKRKTRGNKMSGNQNPEGSFFTLISVNSKYAIETALRVKFNLLYENTVNYFKSAHLEKERAELVVELSV